MQPKYAILMQPDQDEVNLSQELAQMLETFLWPLLVVLDTSLDKRLVRTLVQCCVAIIRFRNNQRGLLLSELGSYMDGSVLSAFSSTSLEAIAPVLSSKAKCTARSRKGLLFNLPPLRPIRVMGMEWTGTIITGLQGIPRLAVMRLPDDQGGLCRKDAREGRRDPAPAGA